MNLAEFIKAGETVEIQLGAITTRTKIEKVNDISSFVILQPTFKLLPILFQPKEIATFFFYRENGMHSFDAEFESKSMIGNLHVCTFTVVSEVEKRQRRFSYRLPVSMDITVRRKNQYDQAKSTEYMGRTINLSQDGMLFTCYQRMPVSSRLLIELKFSGQELCIINADVLRCMLPIKQGDPYSIAVKFISMTKRDRAQLSKFILNRQIEQRRTRPDDANPEETE